MAAPAEVLFDIVTDPRMHHEIDEGGTVTGVRGRPERLTAGARFARRGSMLGLPYRVPVTVVEFEQDRRIAWRHPGGHRWRWEFEPSADGGTVVRHTYAHGRVLAPWPIGRVGLPPRARTSMPRSLDILERLAAERTAERDGDVVG